MQSFWRQLRSLVGGSKTSAKLFQRVRKVWSYHPSCDSLEDRITPTLFNVTSTADPAVEVAGTLRYAVDHSASGDVVQLQPGTYQLLQGELHITHNLVISAAPANTPPFNPANTVIEQTTPGDRVIELTETNATTPSYASILGVTIEGGSVGSGSVTSTNGGGILVDDQIDHLFMQNCTITGNTATSDGVTAGDGGGVYTPGVATFIDCTISNNSAISTGSYLDPVTDVNDSGTGGGVFAGDALTLIGLSSVTTVTGNSADPTSIGSGGGGIYSTGVISLTNANVIGNSAGYHGGGIYDDGPGASVTLLNSNVDSNTTGVGLDTTVGEGAGIWAQGDISVTGGTVSYNEANGNGGGIHSDSGTVTLVNTVVQFNTINAAALDDGGGIYAGSDVSVTSSTINDNTASASGGGIYSASGAVSVTGTSAAPSSLIDNTATRDDGGGIYAENGASVTLSKVDGNEAGTSGGGIYAAVGGVSLTGADVSNNNAEGGDGGGISSGNGIDHAIVHDFVPGDAGGNVIIAASPVAGKSAIPSTVTGNTAKEDGGGIFATGGNVDVTGSQVNGNTAQNFHEEPDDNSGGGGIYVFGGNVTLLNSSVDGNTAQNSGGGIFVDEGVVNITGSDVSHDTSAKASGGGIYAESGGVVLITSTMTFDSAHASGGGIWDDDGGVSLSANSQVSDNDSLDGSGGGIWLEDGSVSLSASSVDGNTAQLSGGGIWVEFGGVTLTAVSAVNGNTSNTEYGGGIYVSSDDDEGGGGVNVSGSSTVNSNQAHLSGGGIYSDYGGVTVTSSTVNSNTSHDGSGGGIYSENGGVIISGAGSAVDGNTAYGAGGGIYGSGKEAGGGVSLTSSDVSNNISQNGAGGGVYSQDGGVLVTTSTVTGNKAQGKGGGIYSADGGVIVSAASHVNSNQARNGSGGGIYADEGGVSVSGLSSVDSNTASGSGGGIYANDGVTLVNADVSSNRSSDGSGGGIYASDGVTASASTINSNTSFSSGGGIYANSGGVILTGTTVNLNTVLGDHCGGGIYANDGAELTSSTVNGNITGGSGGGIYNDGDALTLVLTAVTNNTATYDGGGIYAGGSALTVTTSTISGNRATAVNGGGGGIYVYEVDDVAISASTISGNKATTNGGGIYLSDQPRGFGASITNTTIGQNTASHFGGGIYTTYTTVALNDDTVNLNSASGVNGGGGIYAALGTVTLENTIVAGSTPGNFIANGGTFVSLGHNISSDNSAAGFFKVGGFFAPFASGNYDQNNVASVGLLSSTLAANGSTLNEGVGGAFGPALTYALVAGGPAVDAGDGTGPSVDERGVARPAGTANDIGAYESALGVTRTPAYKNIYDVNNTGSGYAANLAAAIVLANSNPDSEILIQNGSNPLTINLTSALPVINANVTITTQTPNTQGNVTINQTASNARVFEIGAGVSTTPYNVQMIGLTISGGNITGGNGGGILVDTPALATTPPTFLALTNSIVIDNQVTGTANTAAAEGDGGGIYTPGVLLIKGSKIGTSGNGNSATGYGGGTSYGGNGGGIWAGQAATLIGSLDEFNTATQTNSNSAIGGGIFTKGSLNVINSSVSDNHAGSAGGGIADVGLGATVTLSGGSAANSNTLNSLTDSQGGGIYAEGNVTLLTSTACDNFAGGDGGGIFSNNGVVTLAGSTVDGNTASTEDQGGGGIWADYDVIVTTSGTTDSHVDYNHAFDSGGGIYSNDGNVSVTGVSVASPSTVNDNSAANGEGGGIRAENGVSLSFAQTDYNTAAETGVGIHTSDNGVILSNANVIDNMFINSESDDSGDNGAGIYAFSGGAVSITNSTVDDNGTCDTTKGNSGGGVYADHANVILSNSHVDYNEANNGSGGGIFDKHGSVSLSAASTANDNTAHGSGGGIAAIDGSISLNASFANLNTIYDQITSASVISGDGGTGYADGDILSVMGGNGTPATLEVTEVCAGGVVMDVEVVYGGSYSLAPQAGGVSNVNEEEEGSGALFTFASTSPSGGGIYTDEGNVILSSSSTVNQNTADSSGGGIYSNDGNVSLSSSSVNGNTARQHDGGGISAGGSVNLISSTVGTQASPNTSHTSGGGIYGVSSVNLTGSHADYNVVTGLNAVTSAEVDNGGTTATYVVGDVLTVQGGIGTSAATLLVTSVDDGSVTGVTVITGGAYSVDPTNPVTTTGGSGSGATFDLTLAAHTGLGGGIYADYGGVTLSGSTADHNSAFSKGGGIFAYDGVNLVATSDVSSNTVYDSATTPTTGSGGGVYSEDALVYLSSSTVNSNKAGLNAGGIDVGSTDDPDGAGVYLLNSTVNSNKALGSAGFESRYGGIFTSYGAVLNNSSVNLNSADGSGGGVYSSSGGVSLANTSHVNTNSSTGITGVTAVTVETPGSGYVVGDVLTVQGGAFTTPATLTVLTINDGGPTGGVLTVALTNPGAYTIAPTNNVSVSDAAHPSANGATFDLTIPMLRVVGGGIFADDSVDVTSGTTPGSTVDGNTVVGSCAASGGGIYADGAVSLINSDVSSNTATNGTSTIQATEGEGGGIYANGGVTVVNSTVNTNTAGESGGGIYAEGGSVVLTANSVMNGNKATNAIATATAYFGSGGGIYFDNTNGGVWLTSSTISNNTAGLSGGGVYINNGNLHINLSTLSGNQANNNFNTATAATSGDGGAIYDNFPGSAYDLSINNSTFSTNKAYNGAGVFAYGVGNTTIYGSTFNGNVAVHDGGALYITANDEGPAFGATITNTTIGANTAGHFGGGIFADENSVSILDATIALNSSASVANSGGAIFGNSGTINLMDAIAVVNNDSFGAFGGTGFESLGHNLATGHPAFFFPGNGDLFTTNPLLGALQNNGGPTSTYALQSGSPAINNGNDSGPSVDQRGDNRLNGSTFDIGAYDT